MIFKGKIPQRVTKVFKKFEENGYEIWLVGGAVRNLLMGKKIVDADFTTNATPEQIQELYPDSFYDNSFGTVGVPMEGEIKKPEIFEITTYRTETGYSDRRRPDKVKWGKSLEEDLKRRDFTINAVVIGKNKIIDPFKGREDLKTGIIRAVGKAEDRFGEDALRMMRAVRIGTQLNFEIEKETLKAIRNNASLLRQVSFERVRDELIKILSSDYAAEGILWLYSSGLLNEILPEMLKMRGVKQIGHHIYDVWEHSIEALRGCPSTNPIVRLATLLHDVGKPKTARPRDGKEITFYGHEVVGAKMVKEIAGRLRFSKKEIKKLVTLVRWHMFAYDTKMTDAAIRRFVKRVGVENINDMMMLRVGDRKGGGSKATSWRLRELQERVGEQLYQPLTIRDLKIDGRDVMKTLKLKPGPKVGKILKDLFEEVMENSSKNTKQYLLTRIKQIKDGGGGKG